MTHKQFESKLLEQINSIDRLDEGIGSTILNWLFGSKFKKILKDVTKEEEDFPEYQAALQDLYFNLDKLKDIHTRYKAQSKKMGYLK